MESRHYSPLWMSPAESLSAVAAGGAAIRSSSGSKFSRPRFWPALDDDLLVGVKLDCVPPLSVHYAQETVSPATEREISHGCSNSNVNSNVASRHFVPKLSCSSPAARKNRSHIPKWATRQSFNPFFDHVGVNKAQSRAEDFSGGRGLLRRGGFPRIFSKTV